MNQFKSWYQSLGVWGSLGTIVVGLLNALHIVHTATLENDLNSWSASAGVVVFGIVTLYARLRAIHQIGTPADPTAPGIGRSFSGLKVLILSLILIVGLTGCQAIPSTSYVAADRATYTAVAPEYTAYVTADINLDADAKARRGRTIDTWRVRLESAEKATTQPATATPSP